MPELCRYLFVGACFYDLEVGDATGADAIVEVLDLIKGQIDHDLAGRVLKDGTYTYEQVRTIAADLWYFATCGLVGTPTKDLTYGTNLLVLGGVYQKPQTLVNTGDYDEAFDAVAALNALL